MEHEAKKPGPVKAERPPGRLQLEAIGMEAEFSVMADGQPARPEALFGDPRAFLGNGLMHRTGTSYHLPTGGAVYFDTGVIEVATPVIEVERGCAARAGRSLWEGIRRVREGLDGWEQRTGREVRLVGFSTHYNISFERPPVVRGKPPSVDRLALLLAHILPVPVMLLATNRLSTGVGVRPRGDRIEITADFTPSPALMIAAATTIVGIARAVMRWPSYDLSMLEDHGLPVIRGYSPVPHSTRQGWVARPSCFPRDPFGVDIDEPAWELEGGGVASLRAIGRRIVRRFRQPIRRLADPFTHRLIDSILSGSAPALLELPDRPPEYEDVGRLCAWDDLFPERVLSRSRYERVLTRAVAGKRLRMHGRWYRPVGMEGWSRVVFRREEDGSRRTFPIDYLLRHLRDWEREPVRRSTARRSAGRAGDRGNRGSS